MYFIKAGDYDIVKIGITSNLKSRLSSLKSGWWFEPEVLFLGKLLGKYEYHIHKHLTPYKIKGVLMFNKRRSTLFEIFVEIELWIKKLIKGE